MPSLKLAIGVTLSLLGGLSHASNLVANGSFEGNSATPLAVNHGDVASMQLLGGSSYIPHWTVTGMDVAWIGTGNPYSLSASTGDRFLDLTGWTNNVSSPSGVVQTIHTMHGQRYTLGFDVGNSANYNYGHTDELIAAAGGTASVFTNTDTTGNNSWQHFTLDFTATGSTTDIAFTGKSGIYYIGLDNVTVTAAVPEPETYALLLAGLGLVGAVARRRKHKQLAAL